MDSHTLYVVVRSLHILFGAFWIGSAALVALFVLPSVRAAGPAGGAVMQQLVQIRRMPNYILGASVVALISGAYLYWRASGGLHYQWILSRSGVTFSIGGLLALTAAAVGSFVTTPAAARMSAIGAHIRQRGGPPSPDEAATMQTLQARMFMAAQLIFLLLVGTVTAMALGYYI